MGRRKKGAEMRGGHFIVVFGLSCVYCYLNMEETGKTIERNDNHVRVILKLPSVITKDDRA